MIEFIKQAIRDHHHTGAVAPSSLWLAREMTRAARTAESPKRILEVGPGTGSFTAALLTGLRPDDELHIVEVNPQFCARLQERLVDPFLDAHAGVTVEIHNDLIQEADVVGPFDYIVCGLPFNNFPLPLVRSIFRTMLDLLAPGGELTYFEYVGMKAIKAPLVGPRGRDLLRQRDAIGKVLERRHDGSRRLVLRNFPPAYAVKLTRTA